MKNKFIISLFVIAFLVIGFLWLSHDGKKLKQIVSQETVSTNVLVVKNVAQPNASVQQADTNAIASVGQISSTADSVTPEEKEAKMRAAIEAKNAPFDFYGRVIDQDSNSLSGVKFKLALRHWNTTTLGAIHIERETDADGRFDIHGETGDAFDIEDAGKEGYELEPGQRGFGAVGGSIENPVIFKMWSTNVHEQLITGGKKLQIVPDGRLYMIDLTKGTIAESGSGDLKVWIQYTNQVVRGQFYDWSAGIEVVNGGLLEEQIGTAMYEAPTDGYVPSFQLQGQIKGGQRGDIGERHFYLKLNNGQEYGQITIELFAPFNDQVPGLIRLLYTINPSGSRILR